MVIERFPDGNEGVHGRASREAIGKGRSPGINCASSAGMKALQLPLPLFQSVAQPGSMEKAARDSRPTGRKGRVERKSASEQVRRAV
jgi:hypothetical protein